jgi:hypothetical protein
VLKEAFGDNALGLTQTYERFKRFKNWRLSVDNDERSGPSTRTMTRNVAKVWQANLEDWRLTIHNGCDIVKLSYGTWQQILSDDLNMQRIAVKFVPRMLSNDQKEHRVAVCSELNEETENDPNFIWWWILDLQIRPWDEAAIISVEDTKFTVTQESTSLKQCQINVDLLSWHWRQCA